MQGSWKEQLKQKFRNGRRVDPSDARDKDKENSQPNGQDDTSEPPAKKQRQKSARKSRIASEGMWDNLSLASQTLSIPHYRSLSVSAHGGRVRRLRTTSRERLERNY